MALNPSGPAAAAREEVMQDISREQVQRLMSREDVRVVEVLPEQEYRSAHIPGALNIPMGSEFDRLVQRSLPDKNTPVIVYCANNDCSLSPRAAKHLDELGYNKVFDYSAGKADWQQAGLQLIGERYPEDEKA
jgi:rhodanese-related sulfurtransferase